MEGVTIMSTLLEAVTSAVTGITTALGSVVTAVFANESLLALIGLGIAFAVVGMAIALGFGVHYITVQSMEEAVMQIISLMLAAICLMYVLLTFGILFITDFFPLFLSKISFAIESPKPVPPISLVRALSTL